MILCDSVEPGGEVLLVNHFSQDTGVRGWIEQKMAGFKSTGLWRPEFPVDRVMVCDRLELKERRDVHPFGLFTMLRFRKLEEDEQPRPPKMSRRPITSPQYEPSTVQAGL